MRLAPSISRETKENAAALYRAICTGDPWLVSPGFRTRFFSQRFMLVQSLTPLTSDSVAASIFLDFFKRMLEKNLWEQETAKNGKVSF